MGYADQSKAYQIWLPDPKKTEFTRDVKFLESDQNFLNKKDPECDWFDIEIARKSAYKPNRLMKKYSDTISTAWRVEDHQN